ARNPWGAASPPVCPAWRRCCCERGRYRGPSCTPPSAKHVLTRQHTLNRRREVTAGGEKLGIGHVRLAVLVLVVVAVQGVSDGLVDGHEVRLLEAVRLLLRLGLHGRRCCVRGRGLRIGRRVKPSHLRGYFDVAGSGVPWKFLDVYAGPRAGDEG